jgi:RNA polymerase sigma-70 factor (ECF subfamily)
MAKQAHNPDKEHLFDLRMQIVQGIDPFESPSAELQLHHYAHNSRVMENFLKKNEV